MADIKQAAKWMQEGKRVRLAEWAKGAYWYMRRGVVLMMFGVPALMTDDILLATTWEIAEERMEAHNGKDNG